MVRTCNICKSSLLRTVWELPDFPLTGIYVDNPWTIDYLTNYPQGLQFCQSCSHAQLENQIDPTFLYRDTYTHRTSKSPISFQGNKYLLEYVRSVTKNQKFNQVLEIGCNDLFLLESLKDRSKNQAGIDPIWPDGLQVSGSGIRLWGGFAENVNYSELLNTKIDLIVSAHTFEHITNPRLVIENLKGHLSDNCIFVVEIPSAERMLEQGRLDQVFNQHVNYYTVKSIEALLNTLGFKLIDLNYNFSYWGGTQLLMFSLTHEPEQEIYKRELKDDNYLQAIALFLAAMQNMSQQIENSRGPVYLYGAAQMLPSLIYHFTKGAVSKICGIIDDNPIRHHKYYPNINIPISSSKGIPNLSDSTIVISALDSSRAILNQLLVLNPRTLIIPNGLI